jgi:hypothetical protein
MPAAVICLLPALDFGRPPPAPRGLLGAACAIFIDAIALASRSFLSYSCQNFAAFASRLLNGPGMKVDLPLPGKGLNLTSASFRVGAIAVVASSSARVSSATPPAITVSRRGLGTSLAPAVSAGAATVASAAID